MSQGGLAVPSKGFPEGTIKTLDLGFLLRGTRISVEVLDPIRIQDGLKVTGEL